MGNKPDKISDATLILCEKDEIVFIEGKFQARQAMPDPIKSSIESRFFFKKDYWPQTNSQLEEKWYHEALFSTAKLILFEKPILDTTFSTGWKTHQQQSKKPRK